MSTHLRFFLAELGETREEREVGGRPRGSCRPLRESKDSKQIMVQSGTPTKIKVTDLVRLNNPTTCQCVVVVVAVVVVVVVTVVAWEMFCWQNC